MIVGRRIIMRTEILAILPNPIRQIIQVIESSIAKEIEEIRLRENRPLEISYLNRFSFYLQTEE